MRTPTTLHRLEATLILALALAVSLPAAPAAAEDEAAPKMNLSFPGDYVRRVENDQAVLVLGYRTANLSVGESWMLLEIAMTAQPGHDMTLTRDAFTLETPDGTIVQLASQKDFNANSGTLRALDQRASIQRDSLNYLPARANRPCRIGFFSDLATPERGMSWDQFDVNPEMGCVGRLYFEVPGGIQYGRYFLHVDLPDGEIAAPMTVMTKDELKAVKAKVKAYQKEQKKLAKEQKKQAGGAE
jgi:hypothetical protein